jgi:hypothetical protein
MMCFSSLAMRLFLVAVAVFLFFSTAWPQEPPGAEPLIGSWEGESKCSVIDSPCHDEHALYRIAADKKNPAQLNVDGYKIVNGSQQFMGTLIYQYRADQAKLSCTGNTGKKDDWEFHVSADTMTGTLTIGTEKTLYRRITLRKARPKAN